MEGWDEDEMLMMSLMVMALMLLMVMPMILRMVMPMVLLMDMVLIRAVVMFVVISIGMIRRGRQCCRMSPGGGPIPSRSSWY